MSLGTDSLLHLQRWTPRTRFWSFACGNSLLSQQQAAAAQSCGSRMAAACTVTLLWHR
jgi:hypothetical protein